MPSRPDWTYGTILVNPSRYGRRVMFLGWDDRAPDAFTVMALDSGGNPFAREVGSIMTVPWVKGWARVSSHDEVTEALRQMPMRQVRELFERLFAARASAP